MDKEYKQINIRTPQNNKKKFYVTRSNHIDSTLSKRYQTLKSTSIWFHLYKVQEQKKGRIEWTNLLGDSLV